TEREELAVGLHARVFAPLDRVEGDDLRELWDLAGLLEPEQHLELARPLAEDHLRPGVAEDEGRLLGGGRVEDRSGDAARYLGAVLEDDPLRLVLADEADAIAGLEPEGHEP